MIAHVGGVPVEEALPALAGGTSTGLLLVGGWMRVRLRRRRSPRA